MTRSSARLRGNLPAEKGLPDLSGQGKEALNAPSPVLTPSGVDRPARRGQIGSKWWVPILCAVLVFGLVAGSFLQQEIDGKDPLALFFGGNASKAVPAAPATPTQTVPTARGAAFPSVGPLPSVVDQKVAFTKAGLYFYSPEGIQCPLAPLVLAGGPGPYSPHFIPQPYAPSDELVLASDQLTYQSNQIQEMERYAQGIALTPLGPDLPSELAWVPGASLAESGAGCSADVQVTNTSNQAISISQAGVQLSATPVQNPYHYRLIDLCSLGLPDWNTQPGEPSCSGPGGKSGPYLCNTYTVTIQLHNQSAEASFFSPFAGVLLDPAPPCPELRLAPGDTVELWWFFTSVDQPGNLIYSIVPQLTLDQPGGPQIISLQQLGTSLVFANPNQFACYSLQGQTFVQAPSAQTINANRWCI